MCFCLNRKKWVSRISIDTNLAIAIANNAVEIIAKSREESQPRRVHQRRHVLVTSVRKLMVMIPRYALHHSYVFYITDPGQRNMCGVRPSSSTLTPELTSLFILFAAITLRLIHTAVSAFPCKRF